MEITLKTELSDDQLNLITRGILEELKKDMPNYGKRVKPYTVKEFAALTPWTERTVRYKIEANLIETVDLPGQVLIPAREYERLFG